MLIYLEMKAFPNSILFKFCCSVQVVFFIWSSYYVPSEGNYIIAHDLKETIADLGDQLALPVGL